MQQGCFRPVAGARCEVGRRCMPVRAPASVRHTPCGLIARTRYGRCEFACIPGRAARGAGPGRKRRGGPGGSRRLENPRAACGAGAPRPLMMRGAAPPSRRPCGAPQDGAGDEPDRAPYFETARSASSAQADRGSGTARGEPPSIQICRYPVTNGTICIADRSRAALHRIFPA